MAEENLVVGCHTVDSWKEQFEKGKDSQKLVVVDFTASWCGPCRFIAPILADLAKRTPEAVFLKVDIDELKTVAEEWEIEAMPTFILFKEGKVVDKIIGAKKDDLVAKIQQHST